MSSYRRDRPQINVVALGHASSGKTTLAAAMTQVMASRPDGGRTKVRTVAELTRGSSGPTDSPVQLAYETPARRVLHGDLPGRPQRIRTVARALPGCDAALLVVSARDGVMPQSREHLYWARAAGIARAVVFVNHCDVVKDLEQLDLVEGEAREALSACGFAGDDATVLRGSALGALSGDPLWTRGLDELADVLDHEIPQPTRDEEGLAQLQVEHVYRPRAERNGRWLQCCCAFVRVGTVRRGDTLRLLYRNELSLFEVIDLEIDGAKVSQGVAGDYLGLLLRPRDDSGPRISRRFRRGPLLLSASAPDPSRAFRASLSLLTKGQGGRHQPMRNLAVVHVVINGVGASGRVRIDDAVGSIAPGGRADVDLVLEYPTVLRPGLRFVLRDGSDGYRTSLSAAPQWGGTVALGEVRALLPDPKPATT